MSVHVLMAIARVVGNFRNWLRCYLRHGGHAWALFATTRLRSRRCARCTFAIVDTPMGRLRTFDPDGAFNPAMHVPPPLNVSKG